MALGPTRHLAWAVSIETLGCICESHGMSHVGLFENSLSHLEGYEYLVGCAWKHLGPIGGLVLGCSPSGRAR